MKTTVGRLARIVNGTVVGNKNTSITGFSGIKEARPGDITLLTNTKYLPLLKETRASAVVIADEVNPETLPHNSQLAMLQVKTPDLAFAQIVERFSPKPATLLPGIHPKAIIARDVKLGKQVSIQPYVVIQSGAQIGDNTVIYPNVYIGHEVSVGNNCCIYPNVVIREKCRVGNNVIIHSGTVIGSDGFGYTRAKGVHRKIPQTGIAIIEDDVEIGANVTIDRARFDKTIIGKGTKIDNLVQIAHNVVIGENSIIISQAGISGSSRLGKNVTLAGQVGLVGHIQVGDNVTVAARGVVTKNIPANMIVSGFPAQLHKKEIQIQALIRKLPQLVQTIKRLQDKIRHLKAKSEDQ